MKIPYDKLQQISRDLMKLGNVFLNNKKKISGKDVDAWKRIRLVMKDLLEFYEANKDE